MNVALNVAGWRIVAVRAYLGAPFVILEQSSFTALSIQKRWQSGWQSWAGQATIALALPSSQVEAFLACHHQRGGYFLFLDKSWLLFLSSAVLCLPPSSEYITIFDHKPRAGCSSRGERDWISLSCYQKHLSESILYFLPCIHWGIFTGSDDYVKKKNPKSPTLNKSSTSYRGWKALTGLNDGVTFVLHARNSALPPYLHHSCSMHTP